VVAGAVAGSVVGKDPLLDEHPSVLSLMFMIIESLHVPPRSQDLWEALSMDQQQPQLRVVAFTSSLVPPNSPPYLAKW
jgi:hypothetical protein